MAYDRKNPDGYKIHSYVLKQLDNALIIGETIEIAIGETVFWIVKAPFIAVYRCIYAEKT